MNFTVRLYHTRSIGQTSPNSPDNFTNNLDDLNRKLLLLLFDSIFGHIQAQRHFTLGGFGNSKDCGISDVRVAENCVFQACR